MRMQNSQDPLYPFLCMLDGFYFNNINRIVECGGQMGRLSAKSIPEETQAEYLKILQDFETGQ